MSIENIILAVFVSLLLIAIGILWGRVVKERRKNESLMTQMNRNRTRMSPHFISNSLNAIEGLMNTNQNKIASKYLIHFSRLAHKILQDIDRPYVSLHDELETLKHFLALEQLRFRDKLSYEIQVDPTIVLTSVKVPVLFLQPFVEKAIYHGIRPKDSSGHLFIHIKEMGSAIQCVIKDDGIGRKKAHLLQSNSVLKEWPNSPEMSKQAWNDQGNADNFDTQVIDLHDDFGIACGTEVVVHIPNSGHQNKKKYLPDRVS